MIKLNKYKSHTKLTLLIISLFILSACDYVQVPTPGNYNTAINSWRGAQIKQLEQVWGIPSKTTQLVNNTTVYEYNKQRVVTTAGYSTPGQITPATVTGGQNSSYIAGYSDQNNTFLKYCHTKFVVGSDGVIRNVDASGNDCRASQDQLARLKRNYSSKK